MVATCSQLQSFYCDQTALETGIAWDETVFELQAVFIHLPPI